MCCVDQRDAWGQVMVEAFEAEMTSVSVEEEHTAYLKRVKQIQKAECAEDNRRQRAEKYWQKRR